MFVSLPQTTHLLLKVLTLFLLVISGSYVSSVHWFQNPARSSLLKGHQGFGGANTGKIVMTLIYRTWVSMYVDLAEDFFNHLSFSCPVYVPNPLCPSIQLPNHMEANY